MTLTYSITVNCRQYTAYCILYTVTSKKYTVNCILYSVFCFTEFCILHIFLHLNTVYRFYTVVLYTKRMSIVVRQSGSIYIYI